MLDNWSQERENARGGSPQILIYLSNSKYNAPECFEMLRGKTSIWVSF